MALELSWPLPKPLEGVKSRKRRIFAATSVQLQVGKEQVVTASDLSLTLASRIAAVGEAGSAAANAWLLSAADSESQAQELQSGVSRHEGLAVAYFGPGRLGSSSAAAIATEMAERCPQVVVLDEAAEVGDAAWKQTFAEVIRSQALHDFRGAVVVCVADETQDLAQVCSERWAAVEGVLCQEPYLEVIENALDAEATAEGLMKQALEIQSCNLSYWINKSRENGWKITLFGRGGPDRSEELIGFLCHHMIERLGEFKVEFVFVPEWLRGGGFGKRLVRWVIDRAACLPQSECRWISLSAVDWKVPFYEKFGFTDMGSCNCKDDEEQTWMELRNVSRVQEEA